MNAAWIPSLASWLLTIVLHSGLLLAAAWMIERALRLAPPARELVWRCALFGGVLTASLQSLALTSPHEWRLTLPAAAATNSISEPVKAAAIIAAKQTDAEPVVVAHAPSTQTASGTETIAASAPSATAPDASAEPASRITQFTSRLPAFVLVIWLGGALFAGLRLGRGLSALRRAKARARPAAQPANHELATLARRAGSFLPSLYTLPDIASPFAFGRSIVVPDWAPDSLDARQLRAMLAHELAHLVRRDPQWKLAIEYWRALLWFLPFAGLAQRRLDELAELACDAFAARQTGDARAVAECLASCAERHFDAHTYALMPAMAARGSALIQRIDQLLEGTVMSTTKPGLGLRAAAAAVLIACAFGLPTVGFLSPVALAQTPPSPPSPPSPPAPPKAPKASHSSSSSHSSISITSNDDSKETRVIINDDEHGLSLDMKGKIEFTADESDVAALSAGGSASFEEKRNGTTHRLELAERGGKLERRYFVDRSEQPFDADGRAWFAALLPKLIRESGLGAEARVQRLYANGGAAAVLAEVEQIYSDYVRGLYLGLLVDQGPLSPADLDHCMRLAGAIGGDYEKHQALARIFAKQKLDASQQSAFLQQALNIHGAYELSELLIGILPRLDDNAEVRSNWLAAAAHIDGDYERSRTLQAVLDRRDLNDGELASLLVASGDVHGDYEHSQVLVAIARHARNVDAIAPAYAQSVLKIGSDYERAQSLLALIHTGKLGAAGANAVLDATAKSGADYERSQVLIALAKTMPDDAALVARYHEVASHLAEYERGQVESALRR
jgi:beta-lactamase regulating signal transducer with metallopeptidase domain